MSHDDSSHPTIISDALRDLDLGQVSPPDAYQLLVEGGSGSSVYAFHIAGEQVVLKVTLPSSPPALLVQARREAGFYRRLAQEIPLAVSRLLAISAPESGSVAILLGAEEPAPPLPLWTERHYRDIATQLGQLHGRFWGAVDRLRTFDWLHPEAPPSLSDTCDEATSTWQFIGMRDDLGDSETRVRLRAIPGLVARLPALGPPPALPDTLCHGDCHPGNLLRGKSGKWVWVDWQAVRIGAGSEDLAFFWQRAEMADGRVPRETMLDAYLTALEAEGAATPTAHQLERALAWAELRSWLLDWPPYLAHAAAPLLGVVLDRIDDLTGRLRIGRPD